MNSPLTPTGYGDFFTEVKTRVQVARLMAGKAVNRELVETWQTLHATP